MLFAVLVAAAQTDFLFSAGRKPPLDPYANHREFDQLMDQGLQAFMNQKNYWVAAQKFEAAVKLMPKDITARKALRLARNKLKTLPPEPAPVPVPVAVPELTEPVPPVPEHVEPSPDTAAQENETVRHEHIDVHYNSGLVAFMEENYSKTIKEMEAILRLDPGHAKARKLLMKAYSRAR